VDEGPGSQPSAGADVDDLGSLGPGTDWAALWGDLVEARARCRDDGSVAAPGDEPGPDPWASRALDYDERVARRWAHPDSTRAFIRSQVRDGATVLDIGAGTGAWAAFLAPRAASVTAVERSPAMIERLRENLAVRGIANVRIVQGGWPDVAVEPHDYALCAHAAYWYPDLPRFVQRMSEVTRRACFLVLRDPRRDGVMAEAARLVLGHPLDSPNFTVAHRVLLQAGMRPRVVVERGAMREPRRSASLDDALWRLKRHFGLCDDARHDDALRRLLARRLVRDGDGYAWPPDGGTALLWWATG
jgi:SAM-dependent methyltransferase